MADTYTPPDGGNIIFQWDSATYTPPDGGNIVFSWGESTPVNNEPFIGTIPGNTSSTWDGGGIVYIPGNPAPSSDDSATTPVTTKPVGSAAPSSSKKPKFSLFCVNLRRGLYLLDETNIISPPPSNVNNRNKKR